MKSKPGKKIATTLIKDSTKTEIRKKTRFHSHVNVAFETLNVFGNPNNFDNCTTACIKLESKFDQNETQHGQLLWADPYNRRRTNMIEFL